MIENAIRITFLCQTEKWFNIMSEGVYTGMLAASNAEMGWKQRKKVYLAKQEPLFIVSATLRKL